MYDADVSRADGTLKGYSNLVFTREPVAIISLTPWIKRNSAVIIAQPEDIKKYKVGHVRGLKLAENFCIQNGIEAVIVANFEALVKMLEFGRLDVALSATPLTRYSQNDSVEMLPTVLTSTKSYHVLNAKQTGLIEPFDTILKQMKADGRYQTLIHK